MAYYTAILNYGASPAVEYLVNHGDDIAEARTRFQHLRLGCEVRHLADGETNPLGAYLGTASPSTPSTKAWASASGSYRVTLVNPAGTITIDETKGSLQDYETRVRSLQAQRDLNNLEDPGWSVRGYHVPANNRYDVVAL